MNLRSSLRYSMNAQTVVALMVACIGTTALGAQTPASGSLLVPIDLGPLRAPHGLAFVGGKLWFTAEMAKAIGSYDPASAKVDWILGTGQNRTHMIFVSEDLKRIVTSNVSSATMTFIEKTAGGPGA